MVLEPIVILWGCSHGRRCRDSPPLEVPDTHPMPWCEAGEGCITPQPVVPSSSTEAGCPPSHLCPQHTTPQGSNNLKTPVSALSCDCEEVWRVIMWRNWSRLWRYHCLWCYHHHCHILHPWETFLSTLRVPMMRTVWQTTNVCNTCVTHGRPAQDSGMK